LANSVYTAYCNKFLHVNIYNHPPNRGLETSVLQVVAILGQFG